MKLRTLCMLLVLVLLAVFLVINWSALSQDMTVNLVYQEIQAPLGVIVAAAFGIVVVLQAFYNLWQQASVVVELRQAHKEARNARAEAAEADKNRVNELAREVREGFARMEALVTQQQEATAKLIREKSDQHDRAAAVLRDQIKAEQDAAQSAVSKRLLEIEKKVSNVLPAAPGEVKDEKKTKELLGSSSKRWKRFQNKKAPSSVDLRAFFDNPALKKTADQSSWYAVARSTSSAAPRKTATRSWIEVGLIVRMATCPFVAAAPACSMIIDMGLAS